MPSVRMTANGVLQSLLDERRAGGLASTGTLYFAPRCPEGRDPVPFVLDVHVMPQRAPEGNVDDHEGWDGEDDFGGVGEGEEEAA